MTAPLFENFEYVGNLRRRDYFVAPYKKYYVNCLGPGGESYITVVRVSYFRSCG